MGKRFCEIHTEELDKYGKCSICERKKGGEVVKPSQTLLKRVIAKKEKRRKNKVNIGKESSGESQSFYNPKSCILLK